MSELDQQSFINWLEAIDGSRVSKERVEESWPEFFENYELVGVTVLLEPDTGELMIPKIDLINIVTYGFPRD